MRQHRVAVCTPSRGLIHSRTVQSVLAALSVATESGVTCAGWFITHDLPIPDAHESLAEHAVYIGADALWFVEEDVVVPPYALTALIERQQATGAGVVFVDYPVGEHPTRSTLSYAPDGTNTILYGGLGCTLITRDALTRIPRPWFDTSRLWVYRQGALTAVDGMPYRYGGQDVSFCVKAAAHGVTLAAVTDGGATAGHARLRQMGAAGSNHGTHTIDVLDTIQEPS